MTILIYRDLKIKGKLHNAFRLSNMKSKMLYSQVLLTPCLLSFATLFPRENVDYFICKLVQKKKIPTKEN